MTPQEHALVVSVFTKQMQLIRILLDILTSRGVLQDDDAQAFEHVRISDIALNAAIAKAALEEYLGFARALGIVTGLEDVEDHLKNKR